MKKIILLALLVTGISVYAQVPAINSFSPVSGAVGTVITIEGSNFSSTAENNVVYFGSAKAVISNATSSTLTVIVPFGATFEPISVATNNLVAYSAKPFIVTYPNGGMDFTTSSFATSVNLAGGGTVIDADWDSDGKIDVAYSLFGENRIFFHRNTTSGGAVSFTNFPDFFGGLVNVIGLAKADFNGDGKPDIVASTPFTDAVYVFRNGSSAAGSIFFFGPTAFATGSSPRKVTVADIDGDGKTDIITSNQGAGTVSVLRNTSTASTISFAAKIDFTVATTPEDIAAGDLNADGKPEIAVSCSGSDVVSVLQNTSTTGSVSFAPKVDLITGAYPWGVAIGDLNGDNKPEVISSNLSPNTISVFKNNSTTGSISFSAASDFGTSSSPRGIKLGDLNADGKPDIVAACYFSSSVVSVLKNTSTGTSITFNSAQNFNTSSGPNTIALFDVNNDGLMDIVAGTTTGSFSGNNSYLLNTLNINTTSAVNNIINVSSLLSVYPNPSSDRIVITHPVANKPASISITNINGITVYQTKVKHQSSETVIDISKLNTGVYVLSWKSGNENGNIKLTKK